MNDELYRVASGLRHANIEPDAWMFVEGIVDWTWDQSHLFDKPVYHAEWMPTPNDGRGDPCPWLLLFNTDRTDMGLLNSRFFKGYDDYKPNTPKP